MRLSLANALLLLHSLPLLALLVLPSCAPHVDEEAPAGPVTYLTLVPGDGAPADALERVAARWSAATGLDIAVGDEGVSVSFVPVAHMFETIEVCGVTHSRVDEGPVDITISTEPEPGKCRETEQVLVHEVGHALCDATAGKAELCHSRHGIMASPSYDLGIDASSLESICSYAPCLWMTPE